MYKSLEGKISRLITAYSRPVHSSPVILRKILIFLCFSSLVLYIDNKCTHFMESLLGFNELIYFNNLEYNLAYDTQELLVIILYIIIINAI